MDKARRRAAVAAWRERKVVSGIYALRCAPGGLCWVGCAPDLSAITNRLDFALAHGAGLATSLREAVRTHGAGAIGFEVLERFDEDELAYERNRFLRDRQKHWVATLGAEPI